MKKHLVIIGGGFAGVYAYRSMSSLLRSQYKVTIIDERNYFLFTPFLHGVTGAQEYSYELKSLADAVAIWNRFIELLQEVSEKPKQDQSVRVAVVVGGPTGVELAGELATLFHTTFRKLYRVKLTLTGSLSV